MSVVLIGALCMYSNINCTSFGVIGKPYDTVEQCEFVKQKMSEAVDHTEWLDGKLKCVDRDANTL